MQYNELRTALKGYKEQFPEIVGNLKAITKAEAQKRWDAVQEALASIDTQDIADNAVIAAKAIARTVAPIIERVRQHAPRLAYAALVAFVWTAIRVPGWSLMAMRYTYQAGLYVGQVYRAAKEVYDNREQVVSEARLKVDVAKAEVTYQAQKVVIPVKRAASDLEVKTRYIREELTVLAIALEGIAKYNLRRDVVGQRYSNAYSAAVAGGGWIESKLEQLPFKA